MTDPRERPCPPPALPGGIGRLTTGYRWSRDLVGAAGAAVFRLHGRADAPDLYLKHGTGAAADDVVDEMVRLRWLRNHLPTPDLIGFAAQGEDAWLLTAALPGRTAWQIMDAAPDAREAVVDALAAFLRRLHAIPVATCPFVADPYRRDQARRRIDTGLTDEEDFNEAREGWSAEQVWAAMQALLPLSPDPVVTHGDFSLDNIMVDAGTATGCIDLGRIGIADRWQDLAICWQCLGEFGSDLQRRFLAAYGVAGVDRRKLDYHLLLDELF